MSEQDPFGIRRDISQHLTEEGALPTCEQCNSSGDSRPGKIFSDDDGSVGFGASKIWVHKPYGEADCRYVYICDECFWALQEEAYGGVDPWFVGWEAYVSDPNCRQCQERA